MPSYLELIELGAFPNQLDPWAEQGRYFHQLHAQMIGNIISQIRAPLFKMGYVAGREASLQIAENTIPDIFISQQREKSTKPQAYAALAETMALELGEVFSSESEPELDAVYIKNQATGDLVTILELLSPSNKVDAEAIEKYQLRRKNLLWQGIHVVEVDLTRSVKRLIRSGLEADYPYHIAIHLHDESPRFIGVQLNEMPPRFALPLRQEVLALDIAQTYRQAYRDLMIASHLLNDGRYIEVNLPFPSLIEESERRNLLEQVQTWQVALRTANNEEA